MPRSRALTAVHLPVPFWPAVSRILSTRAVPSSSLKIMMSAGDVNQEGIKDTVVPLGEDGADLVVARAQTPLHDIVSLEES